MSRIDGNCCLDYALDFSPSDMPTDIHTINDLKHTTIIIRERMPNCSDDKSRESCLLSPGSSVKIYYSSYDSLNEAKSMTPGVIGTAASGLSAARLGGLLN